jgi:hypothetical protein
MKWQVCEALMQRLRNASEMLVGLFEGRNTVGRSRRRWKNNIKIDLKGIGCDSVDRIRLDRNRYQRWVLSNPVN